MKRLSLRSTPLRLTAVLVGIFVVSLMATFAVAYFVMRSTFDSALEDEISQKFATYQALQGQDDLAERLAEDARLADPELLILQYLPNQGPPISNIQHVPPVSGFTVLHEKAFDHEEISVSESYLAYSSRVGDGQLIIAQTRSQIVEMGEIFLSMILIGLLPTLIIGTISGALVARGAKRKIGRIQATLHELTDGHMSARVAIAPTETDDLSDIGNTVNTMAASQETLIASMRQISADIAHDLKTPIQRVAVILEKISLKTELSNGQSELLERASDETNRIVQTFQSLLQLAQIEGGAVRDRFVKTDLALVVTDMTEFLEAEAEELGYNLRLHIIDQGPFIVSSDRTLLSQVIANLVQNSLRYTPKGSEIVVSLEAARGRVKLVVADNGPGIPEDQYEKVLQRLYRLEQSRTTEGNGLGLSLVSAICALHGAPLNLSDNHPGLRVEISFALIS